MKNLKSYRNNLGKNLTELFVNIQLIFHEYSLCRLICCYIPFQSFYRDVDFEHALTIALAKIKINFLAEILELIPGAVSPCFVARKIR